MGMNTRNLSFAEGLRATPHLLTIAAPIGHRAKRPEGPVGRRCLPAFLSMGNGVSGALDSFDASAAGDPGGPGVACARALW